MPSQFIGSNMSFALSQYQDRGFTRQVLGFNVILLAFTIKYYISCFFYIIKHETEPLKKSSLFLARVLLKTWSPTLTF